MTVQGRNPLHEACMATHPANKVISKLAKKVHSLEADESGITPLHLLAIHGNWKMCQMLLKAAKNKEPNLALLGNTPSHIAAMFNNHDALAGFLKAGLAEQQNELGFTPLFEAICQGVEENANVINLLLKKGADLTVIDQQGNNLLHCLIDNLTWQPTDSIVSLLEKIINLQPQLLKQKNNTGLTPTQLAKKTKSPSLQSICKPRTQTK